MYTDLIDLKVDFAFKLIFGREGQEPVLVAFLNAVIKPTEGKQILSLTYTNTELTKANADDKKATLDIRAEIQDGRHVNIEIQLENEHNMAKRSLFYWAELFSRQMVQKQAYETLKDTITINILNFDYLKETDEFHSEFSLLEKKKHFSLTDALAMHYIEMPKLRSVGTLVVITGWQRKRGNQKTIGGVCNGRSDDRPGHERLGSSKCRSSIAGTLL